MVGGDRVFRSKTLEIGVEESEERGRQERRGGWVEGGGC